MVTSAKLNIICTYLEAARCPEDVFGVLEGMGKQQQKALTRVYGALVFGCHPDQAAHVDKPLATEVFAQLANWRGAAERKVVLGTYGDRTPAPARHTSRNCHGFQPVELTVGRKHLRLENIIANGLFSTVYGADIQGETQRSAWVKIARSAEDNQYLEREARALRRLHQPDCEPTLEAFMLVQRQYIPRPEATFQVGAPDHAKRRANLLTAPLGRCFTANELLTTYYPKGIPTRHVYWIFRRLLLTLWMAHLRGIVHGAVTPDHILVFPEDHGIMLLDWTCAAEINRQHIPACNPDFRAFYPPEVFDRQPATPATDLYMATASAVWMLGGAPHAHNLPSVIPDPIALLLHRALDRCPETRTQDACAYHDALGEAIVAVEGKRVFSEMRIP